MLAARPRRLYYGAENHRHAHFRSRRRRTPKTRFPRSRPTRRGVAATVPRRLSAGRPMVAEPDLRSPGDLRPRFALAEFKTLLPWPIRFFVGKPLLRKILRTRRCTRARACRRCFCRASPATMRRPSDALVQLLRQFRDHRGPLRPNPLFGELSREQWTQLHLIHAAHHLSFLAGQRRHRGRHAMTWEQFGEIAAVGTALLWTLSTLAWTSAGRHVGALPCCFLRLVIACVPLAALRAGGLRKLAAHRRPAPTPGYCWASPGCSVSSWPIFACSRPIC